MMISPESSDLELRRLNLEKANFQSWFISEELFAIFASDNKSLENLELLRHLPPLLFRLEEVKLRIENENLGQKYFNDFKLSAVNGIKSATSTFSKNLSLLESFIQNGGAFPELEHEGRRLKNFTDLVALSKDQMIIVAQGAIQEHNRVIPSYQELESVIENCQSFDEIIDQIKKYLTTLMTTS